MPTQELILSSSPSNVVADLTLTREANYTLQNVSGVHTVYLSEQAESTVLPSIAALQLAPYEFLGYQVHATNNLFAWIIDPNGAGFLTVTEA